jgi:anti-sigma regulatory factor (Ser/Thr protein kinase)
MEPLIVSGTLASLATIRKFVCAAAEGAGFGHSAAYRLSLAVDEIATNIIVHGYDDAGRKGDIIVWSEMDDLNLQVHVDDTGVAYDISSREHVDSLEQPLEEREEGGLGLFLAFQGVDELRYGQFEDKNRHTFVLKRGIGKVNSPEGRC